ncbi:MAG: hypothetical protein IPI49_29290 [Myxococcales bacterium]|nr:hypothetical protein [Myxococcales bacterium]
MTADEAFAALGKHLDDLARIPFRAWDRYRSDIAPTMAKPPKRMRATAMQALMVEELEAAFGGAVSHRKGRALLCTVPGLVVQCKKLDGRGLPQNYPTRTALQFASQLHIAGIPAGTRLTLGYMLNSPGTAIAEVRLLAQMGRDVAWSRELTVNQTVMPIVMPATTTAQLSAAAPKKRDLQPKGGAKPEGKKAPGV